MKTTLLTFPEQCVGELLDERFKRLPKVADARGNVLITGRPKLVLRLAETTEGLNFLETLPPDVLYGVHFGFMPLAVSRLANLCSLKGLRLVDLSSTGVNDEGLLLILHGLPFLRSVSFGGTKVSDFALRDMPRSVRMRIFQTSGRKVGVGDRGARSIGEKLPGLVKLDLSHTEITDEAIRGVNHLGLRSLNIGMNRITDVGIAHLGGMNSLRILSVHNTAISDVAPYFLQGLDKLEFLDISGTGISAEGLEFVSKIPKLRVLLANSTKLSESAVAALARMTQLRVLSLGVQTDANLITGLREALSSCEVIANP